MIKRTVATNSEGYRIGESHQNAKLTDGEVDLIVRLYESGEWTFATLADKFEISKSSVAMYVRGDRRGQRIDGHKVVIERRVHVRRGKGG